MPITITDKPCLDCGGEVTVYMVPDKVWEAIGLESDSGWLCLRCLAHRLSPDLKVDEIGKELHRQRRRFKLSRHRNRYQGLWMSHYTLITASAGDSLASRITYAQYTGEEKWPKEKDVAVTT